MTTPPVDHSHATPIRSDAAPPTASDIGRTFRLLGRQLVALLAVFFRALRASARRIVGQARGGILRARAAAPTRMAAFSTGLRGAATRLGRLRPGSVAAGSGPPGSSTGTTRGLRRNLVLALTICLVAGAAVAAAFLAYCAATLPYNGGLRVDPAQRALIVEAADGQTLAARGAFRGEKVALADLPEHLKRAVVAIEDRRFYEHPGIDLRGTLRALTRNLRAGGAREGGSTLTQQLVRLSYLSPEKTLRRKMQEAMMSLWLETQLSKDEILQRYLNTAYFGAGAYGIDAAAKRYFDKPPRDLTLAESAMLAGLVRAPSQLAPTRNFGGAKERADTVLQAMVETGALTQADADAARPQDVTLRTPPETPPGANYFIDLAAADQRRLAPAAGDVTLRTTIDLDLQRVAEGVIARHLEAEGAAKGASQAALVALAPDGAVLALVGGRDYEQSQFNRAAQAKRQAGSLFKLFVYLAALEKGYEPDTVLVDRPVQIGDWEPQNASGRFRGRVDLRTAFAQSINTVAARLADEVGIPAVIDTARRLGVQSDLPGVPSLALSSADVTLMEMTRAYASVAAGVAVEPFTVRAIQGGGGQPLYNRSAEAGPSPVPPQVRASMVDLLRAVVEAGTGKAARLPVPVGGKTGTTQDYRDAWFIGSTPAITIGVWVGNDDNGPMKRVSGGDLPARIFHDVVARAAPALAKRSVPTASASLSARPDTTRTGSITVPVQGDLRGRAQVIDTATFAVEGQVVRLLGVEGEDGRMARQLARFLRGREVVCQPAEAEGARCSFDGEDLAAMIVAAGGARAKPDAPEELLAAEEQARSARLGVWRRRR